MTSADHPGVNELDPRNRGVIERFRPQPVTAERARADLTRAAPRQTPAQIEASVARLMAKLASKEVAPPPPLSQSLEAVHDPIFGLGTHPDIVSWLWRLDRALPRSCRWVVWGYPALVHPLTGIIFALAYGTIGIAVRLPPGLGEGLAVSQNTSDVVTAGPEWRFLPNENDELLCRSAYDFAEAL
jgi:hypothetical protein